MVLWVRYLQGPAGVQEQRWGQCPCLWNIPFNCTTWPNHILLGSVTPGPWEVCKLQFIPSNIHWVFTCCNSVPLQNSCNSAFEFGCPSVWPCCQIQLTGKGGRGGVSICSEVNWQQLPSCGFRMVLLSGFDNVCITENKLFPLAVCWFQFVETSDHADLAPLFCPPSCSNQCFVICQDLAGSYFSYVEGTTFEWCSVWMLVWDAVVVLFKSC